MTMSDVRINSTLETEVRVFEKTVGADGVAVVRLRREDGGPLPAFEPGAHIDLLIDGVAPRQYSLCGDAADRRSWRLGILREPHGSGASAHVHDRLQVGDVIRVRGPRNHFPLRAAPRYLFIAGGIGITPLLPMIAAAHSRGAEWRLLYGGRTRGSMAFLDELSNYGDQVEVAPLDEVGLLDLDAVLTVPRKDTLVYCCGPESLLTAVEVAARDWPPGALHVERFSAKPMNEVARADSFHVFLKLSGVQLEVSPDVSVLEAVSAAGIDVLSSCTEGTCGTCETRVLGGDPDHRDSILSEEERSANDCMMICVSRSLSDHLILDL